MTELNYRFKDVYGHYRTLQLSQIAPEDLWCLNEEGVLLARLSKIHDSWKQLSGELLPKELIRGAGAYIQQNYYDSIPLQIKDRWPGIISSAEKKSDSEITIICKPQVNLFTFRSIFCKHVPRLFNQEINVELKVYSYNYAQDFSLKLDIKTKR